jgi:hypothetical protein
MRDVRESATSADVCQSATSADISNPAASTASSDAAATIAAAASLSGVDHNHGRNPKSYYSGSNVLECEHRNPPRVVHGALARRRRHSVSSSSDCAPPERAGAWSDVKAELSVALPRREPIRGNVYAGRNPSDASLHNYPPAGTWLENKFKTELCERDRAESPVGPFDGIRRASIERSDGDECACHAHRHSLPNFHSVLRVRRLVAPISSGRFCYFGCRRALFMTQQYQVRFLQIPRWLALVAGVLAIAFAVALFLLSLTVFLVLLPVIFVVGGLYYLFGWKRRPNVRQPNGVEIIEGEYRVVESERIERDRRS